MQSDGIKCTPLRSSKITTDAVLARNTSLAPKDTRSDDRKISAKGTDQLSVGDAVYAAWWNSKKRDQSYTMFRGTVKATKSDQLSLSYDVEFDDGKFLAGIDKSLVISEHRYLNENLKPVSTFCFGAASYVFYVNYIDLTSSSSFFYFRF
jgi:hypothetical protein